MTGNERRAGRAQLVTTPLDRVREEAEGCTRCDLYKLGTQTVFGEGSDKADVMLVGEQPGDKEDLEGRPFVGPAGRLLGKALAEAGIDRTRAYVTNAVKHFKWKPAGKRRLHQKPNREEVKACKPWLESELQLVNPKLVVCLGATAAQSLLGPTFKVTQMRGQFIGWPFERSQSGGAPHPKPLVMATVHPSSILRGDPESREVAFQGLVADLRVAASALA
jgi:uracil-DNA glycosylase family protein